MAYRAPVRARFVSALLLMLCAALLAGCGVIGGGSKAPESKGRAKGAEKSGAVDGALQFADARLRNLLLPTGAVPIGLAPAGDYLLPNDYVATFFSDQEAALRAMSEAGRMQGAAADYRLRSTPRASEEAVAVSSTISWYKTVAGAQAVLKDPTMELVIHRLGLNAAEINLDKIGQESRAFRGFRDGDGPGLAAYLMLFRRDNVIGAVLVVVPAATDDGGKLALTLARRQADVSLSAAAQR